jgi:hypothetical protein
MDMALFYLKATGKFDNAVRESEAKPAADKTWVNIKSFISTENTKENKQNKLTAKQFRANAIDEQAEAAEELINALTENHTCQMETLIRSITETMKEIMALAKTEIQNPTNVNKGTNEEKKKRQEEKRQIYNNALVCKNHGKKHPSNTEDEYWELKKNKTSRPTNWKASKSTWRCAGSAIETETQQPRKVLDKINTNHTYLDATNYWTPLVTVQEEDKTGEEKTINSISIVGKKKIQETLKSTGNKWTRRLERQKEKCCEHKIIINSRATSHFMSKELDLPNTGPSNKEVYLPDDTKLPMANKTLLPFKQLSKATWEADVLPGLKKFLASIRKLSEEGYTIVFHSGKKGVTVHKPDTLTMTTSELLVLQGHKPRGAKLWTVSANNDSNKQEETHNVYSLPLMKQSIRYLHTAAGFPVEDTWIDAINVGNFNTWPGLSATAVTCHFPELDETQKGHMKKQWQNVRSTKIKV